MDPPPRRNAYRAGSGIRPMAPRKGAALRADRAGDGTVAVVLAAGTSSRMGRPKGAVEFQGRPLLERVLENLRSGGIRSVVVVLGHEAERVRKAVRFQDETVVVASDYRAGMSRSLQTGLRNLRPGT